MKVGDKVTTKVLASVHIHGTIVETGEFGTNGKMYKGCNVTYQLDGMTYTRWFWEEVLDLDVNNNKEGD